MRCNISAYRRTALTQRRLLLVRFRHCGWVIALPGFDFGELADQVAADEAGMC